MAPIFCIGIDLGTSNSAVSVVELGSNLPPHELLLCQCQGPSTIVERTLLPSSLYMPTSEEQQGSFFALPWSTDSSGPVIGMYAKEQESRTPDRVIRSAKSWLCNPLVDRRSAILPWHGADDIAKLSPLDSSRYVLSHIRNSVKAWMEEQGYPEALSNAQVVVTVPASFDEVARQLTFDAAADAGFQSCTLVEEPQAAFYAWLSSHQQNWRTEVHPGDTILVCDVGGGTADFSLIAVTQEEGELSLSRIAVGDHILLGGDNMDLALAYRARATLDPAQQNLDAWQMGVLTYSAQQAKERLLSDESLSEFTITIPTRGANLFAAPLQLSLSRADVQEIVLQGFFPMVERGTAPFEKKVAALTDFGLPYASDPALTKHLSAFLAKSATLIQRTEELSPLLAHCTDGSVRPTAVLFNGGVFNSDSIRSRVFSLLTEWSGGEPIRELTGVDRSHAVSVGAAWYAQLKSSGKGVRVRSATTRSFYVGVESAMPAVPGYTPPLKGLCIAPRGVEEGSDIELPSKIFSLAVGDEVSFQLFSSSSRLEDRAGDELPDAQAMLDELEPVAATITVSRPDSPSRIPVTLHTTLTELGLLEITLKEKAQPNALHTDEWKLAFRTRTETK